ncbi:MAG: ATP-binding protein [bacterium]
MKNILVRILNIGFKVRIVAVIFSISSLIFLTLIINRYLLYKETLSERIVNRINSQGIILAEEIKDNLVEQNFQDIHEIIAITAGLSNIQFATVYTNENIIIASSNKELIEKPNPFTDNKDISKQLYIKSFPLRHKNNTIGFVQLGFSLKKYKNDITEMFIWSVIISITGLILLTSISWLLAAALEKPIKKLSIMAHRIACGDFDARISIDTHDVLGELAETFNNMAEKLDDLTRNLQDKIDSATADLKYSKKQLEARTEELQNKNELLRGLDKLKSEFVTIVSHELRTPLTSIIGFAQTLKTLQLTDEKKERYLTYIESEGKRLAFLIEDFLDISKIESGNINLSLETIDISELVREAVDVLAIRIKQQIKYIPYPVPALVSVDRNRIKQVIMNIVDNAGRYTPEHTSIEIKLIDAKNDIIISIKDEGPGIVHEELPKIFDKFYRGKSAHGMRSGSGLGLSIAKGIIELHRGMMWVESEAGKGTVFFFSVPKKL